MTRNRFTRQAWTIIGGSLAALVTTGAHAGKIPELTIDADLGGVMQGIMPSGEVMGSSFLYERDFNTDALMINVDDGNVSLGWSWTADTTATSRGAGDPVALQGGLVVQNNTSSTQMFSFAVTLPIGMAITPASVIGGSISATLTAGDADGGTLSTFGETAFYQGMIDGSVVPANAADLLPDPSSDTVGAFGSGGLGPASFGDPIPSQPAGAINTSIGILITFELSAGDQMSWTSVFVADIPAPGAAPCLALVGALAARRRRR